MDVLDGGELGRGPSVINPTWLLILAAAAVFAAWAGGCFAAVPGFALGVVMFVVLPWKSAVATWLTVGGVAAVGALTLEWSLYRKAKAAGAVVRPRLSVALRALALWPITLPRALRYWFTKEPPLSPEAGAYLAQAAEELRSKQELMEREWHLGSGGQWGFDQATGVFRLTLADGAEWHADGQMLGSYSATDGTWEWAWNNPNVDRGVSRDSELVREVGGRLGIAYLQAGKIPAPTDQVIAYLSSIGVKATGSAGVFRGSAPSLEVAILLKNPRWVKHSP